VGQAGHGQVVELLDGLGHGPLDQSLHLKLQGRGLGLQHSPLSADAT
jgi:hypothetical protein